MTYLAVEAYVKAAVVPKGGQSASTTARMCGYRYDIQNLRIIMRKRKLQKLIFRKFFTSRELQTRVQVTMIMIDYNMYVNILIVHKQNRQGENWIA